MMAHRVMRHVVLLCTVVLWLVGCAGPVAGAREPQAPLHPSGRAGLTSKPGPVEPPLTRVDALSVAASQQDQIAAEPSSASPVDGSDAQPESGADESSEPPAGGADAVESAPASAAPAASRVTAPPAVKPGTMLDIQAQLKIDVSSVAAAVSRARQIAEQSHGAVTSEDVTDNGRRSTAKLTLRIPPQAAHGAMEALGSLGVVRHRHVSVEDVGRRYYDASIRLANFEMLRKRYERILERADEVEDVLRIERELNVVRERIETLKGELRWLSDRAASATVDLTLVGPKTAAEPMGHAKAKFYPGLRSGYLADFWRETGNAGYLGGGASVRLSREFSIDIDGYSDTKFEGRGLDVLLLTLGGEYYSDFLGGGRRTWFNPYIGYRLGYARVLGDNDAAFGATLGCELFKSPAVVVDLDTRVLGMLGSKQGAHLGLQPGVGFNVAF
ncbi:MAG: DUF4349 domain-containing protein [Polyangiaceae bacterium]|nr:DUF4349 domain-containing protein [Polyangiaceae bacterium]